MDQELIFHIGMPKTGTTILQKSIFPNSDEYLYLGKHQPGHDETSEYRDKWILSLTKDLVSKEQPFFRDRNFKNVISDEIGRKAIGFEKLFLSEESILGRCINPGKYGNSVRVGSAYGIINKLHVLLRNSSFSGIKIIVVLRRQDDLIESQFAEEFHNFSLFWDMHSPSEFADFLLNDGQGEEADSLFRYHALVRHLDSLFGEENVLVLPYEKMKADPDVFLSEVSSFMKIEPWENMDMLNKKEENRRDLKEEEGKVAKVYPMRNKLAKIKKKMFGNVSTGLGKVAKVIDIFRKNPVVKLEADAKKEVMKRYAKGNKKLQNRVKYLSEYGYF